MIDSSIKIVPLDEFNNYYFKAENSICADSSSLQVITQDLDVEVDDYNSICIGDTITISSFNNSPFLINYLWGVNPAIIGSRSNNQIQVSPDSSSYFYLNTNTSIGCLDYDSAYVEVNLPAFDDALILSEFDTIYDGQYTQLSTNRNGNNLSYFWEPSTGLSNPNAANPIINPNQTTIYKVTITDNNTGCVVYAFRRIFVFEINCGEPEIFIPTAFTPNKDGQNDLFKIRGEFLESLNLQIFNRWGEKVFESNSIDDGWDGTYKGELVNPDVFVYHLTTKCFDGQEFFKKGNVTVIR